MPRRTFADVLGRIRLMTKCSLADLEDLLPEPYQNTSTWALMMLRNQLAPLVQMGLVEAYNGLVPLTAAEVARQPSSNYSTLYFCVSTATAALEDILGYDFWKHQESMFGAPIAGKWPALFVVMPFLETLKPIFKIISGRLRNL